MSSSIYSSNLDSINAIYSEQKSIPVSEITIITPNPEKTLTIKRILEEKVTIFRIYCSELFFLIENSFFRYKSKNKILIEGFLSPEPKVFIGKVSPNVKDFFVFSNNCFFLYNKEIFVYSLNKNFEFLYKIKTESALDYFFTDDDSLFVASEKQIYNVKERFIMQQLASSEKIIKTVPMLEYNNLVTLQFKYIAEIHETTEEKLCISVNFGEEISEICHLNSEIMMIYSKKNSNIKAYEWKNKNDPVFEIIFEGGHSLDFWCEDNKIFVYGKETGYISAILYSENTKSFLFSEALIDTPFEDIRFVQHIDSLNTEKWLDGDFFIEIVIKGNGFIGIFNLKFSLSQNFTIFYSFSYQNNSLESIKKTTDKNDQLAVLCKSLNENTIRDRFSMIVASTLKDSKFVVNKSNFEISLDELLQKEKYLSATLETIQKLLLKWY